VFAFPAKFKYILSQLLSLKYTVNDFSRDKCWGRASLQVQIIKTSQRFTLQLNHDTVCVQMRLLVIQCMYVHTVLIKYVLTVANQILAVEECGRKKRSVLALDRARHYHCSKSLGGQVYKSPDTLRQLLI
jgi:hypothetical protein